MAGVTRLPGEVPPSDVTLVRRVLVQARPWVAVKGCSNTTPSVARFWLPCFGLSGWRSSRHGERPASSSASGGSLEAPTGNARPGSRRRTQVGAIEAEDLSCGALDPVEGLDNPITEKVSIPYPR